MPRSAASRALQGLSPTWFSVAMGTGIVAVLGARLTLPNVRVLRVGAEVLFGVQLLVWFGVAGAAVRRDRSRDRHHHATPTGQPVPGREQTTLDHSHRVATSLGLTLTDWPAAVRSPTTSSPPRT